MTDTYPFSKLELKLIHKALTWCKNDHVSRDPTYWELSALMDKVERMVNRSSSGCLTCERCGKCRYSNATSGEMLCWPCVEAVS